MDNARRGGPRKYGFDFANIIRSSSLDQFNRGIAAGLCDSTRDIKNLSTMVPFLQKTIRSHCIPPEPCPRENSQTVNGVRRIERGGQSSAADAFQAMF